MTVKQKAIALAVFAACFVLAASCIPGVRSWLGAFGKHGRPKMIFSPCVQQGFGMIEGGYLRPGMDALSMCPAKELNDPRLQIILSDLEESRKEFQAIMGNWRPEFSTLFINELGLNPELTPEKLRRIDEFLDKHPDNYYSQLLKYTKALALVSGKKFDEARETLSGDSPLTAIGGYAEYLKYYSSYLKGDFDPAAALSATAPGKVAGGMSGEIRLLSARALHDKGDSDKAVAVCREVAGEKTSALTRWHAYDLMSRIYFEKSDFSGAVQALAAAAAAKNIRIEGDLLLIMSERGGGNAPALLPDETRAALARYFMGNGRYFDAITILKNGAGPSSAPEVNLLLGEAYLHTGRAQSYTESLNYTEAVSKLTKDPDMLRRACVMRGGALLKRNKGADRKNAESLLKGCIANYPDKPGQAIEKLVGLLDSSNKSEQSAHYLKILLKSEPGYDDELIARLARASLTGGGLQQAHDAYKAIVDHFPRGIYAASASFWKARIELDRDDKTAAAQSFKTLRRNYPYSYYYFRAGELLDGMGEAPGPVLPPSPLFRPLASDYVRNGYALMDLGYEGAADKEFENALLQDGPPADAATVGLSRMERARGDVMSSVKTMELRCQQSPDFYAHSINNPELRELLFPTLFSDIVKQCASDNSLEPELAMAVIRQESRFNPYARSTSNARGLMQIIPSTGGWIAGQKKMECPVPDKLFDTGLNVDFGTWYLNYLLNKFGGDLRLAIAAYNGGPGNVNTWRKAFRGGDMDLFVECIPRYETRDYVTKVMLSYYVYKQILK